MSIWFKHDAHFHEHPKTMRLRRLAGSRADAAEVGWYRILAAAKRLGSWEFEDEDHLRDSIGRYYGFVELYRSVGYLDGLTIHNGEEYQAPLTPAERQRVSRAQRDKRHDAPVTDVTPRVEKSRESRADTGARDIESQDPADAYWQLTGKYPADKTLGWIDDMAAKFGSPAVIRALAQAFTADRAVATLLGRTQDILRAESRELDRREREDEQRRLREKRAIPREEEPWRIEQRKAYLERYGPDAA